MLIKQVMDRTAAVCVPFDTAKGAAVIMKRNDIAFIPVVENEPTHTYVGAVTDRSLCLRVIGEGLDPSRTQLSECVGYQNVFCRSDDPIEKALQTMRRKRMNALAVLDRNRNVLGVVLLDELLKRTAFGQKANAARSRSKVKQLTASPSGEGARPRVSGVEVRKARTGHSSSVS